MVFCNYIDTDRTDIAYKCHNPYFNRWFSAIENHECKKEWGDCHNPYFNRWFSAI